ncbi:UBP-type zinc finger domain-containing protein [Aeromicrobium fastidiosum]|uniref:UBP-type zinc finger domain-containing protein n=1 Tax=Aeromicrobium fastidiosum TaxID=52699 RepID=A0A641AKM5_9ACTN|nr:UBP-type zinc finger domain-containing protein [Aeromicrobium fastidiosum]MBP2391734.1 hypothetical protein [Aeromicrobium fastidiosum]
MTVQIDTDDLVPEVPPTGTGCVECEQTGGWWFHLRRCARCGHIGCCDDSLSRHATAHFTETGHTVMQSFEPGEDWFWDFASQNAFDGPELVAPHHHPVTQSAPGPAERLPADWQDILVRRQD